jgi:hypothetical protein
MMRSANRKPLAMSGEASPDAADSPEMSQLTRSILLLDEIRKDQEALANYVFRHGDPAAELVAMFEPNLFGLE